MLIFIELYLKIAPVKSYINVRDFESVEKLSQYLIYLNGNDTAYAEYFEWKRYFRVSDDRSIVICQLCEALNDESLKSKVYQDIDFWWNKSGNCTNKGDFPWSNVQSNSASKTHFFFFLSPIFLLFLIFFCF